MSGEIDVYERIRGLGTLELLELAVGDPGKRALVAEIDEDEDGDYWLDCLRDACEACRPKSNERSEPST
jgi:hypothetical protein